ncbi:snaclec 3-like [Physella acuta]|uniref:snaclec 3-like n=1 Tax=Physella acuta TaxID=109671 RepID=UPI0027DE72B4|nr:snaclec 3-like [Physella acuta]
MTSHCSGERQRFIWYGANTIERADTWKWPDGTPVPDTLSQLVIGPDQYWAKKNCSLMDTTGNIFQIDCTEKLSFICLENVKNLYRCNSWTGSVIQHGLCFKIFTIEKSWEDAKRFCELESSDVVLAEMNTEIFPHYLMPSNMGENLECWIGARKTDNKANLTWDDGRTANIDQMWIGRNNCVVLAADGKLEENDCSHANEFVCMITPQNDTGCGRWEGYTSIENTCFKHYADKKRWADALHE